LGRYPNAASNRTGTKQLGLLPRCEPHSMSLWPNLVDVSDPKSVERTQELQSELNCGVYTYSQTALLSQNLGPPPT
jgi:hypothetical protein